MAIFYFSIFVIGLAFGSFASVIIHRLHTREKGILFGRSKCPKCAKTLQTQDLIPLLSYVANKFKCRFCLKPISLKYPILELVMGLSFLLTTHLIGIENPSWLGYWLLLSFIFVTISFYDIFFQEIPDEISLPTIVLTGIVSYFGGVHTGADLAIGFAIPVGFFSALFFGSQGRWLGGGDIRIGAIMGFILGWPLVVVGLFLSYLLGSIYSAFGLASGKLNRKTPIPFGPFLLLGTYSAAFWGSDLLGWYLGHL